MLEDLEGFRRLCSSLSRITPLSFEVRDTEGRLVFSTHDGRLTSEREDLQDLARRVATQSAFQSLNLEQAKPCFGVPLKLGARTIGSLVFHGCSFLEPSEPGSAAQERVPAAKDIEDFFHQLTELMVERSSLQREINEMTQELSDAFEDLHLFSQVSEHVQELNLLDSTLNSIVEEVRLRMNCDLAFYHLPHHSSRGIHILSRKATKGTRDNKALVVDLMKSITAQASLLQEEYFIVNDSEKDPQFRVLQSDPYRFLVLRIRHQDQQYGWLGLISFDMGQIFREGELRILRSLSEQVAAAITNRDLYQDLESFIVNLVKSMVQAIEAKDIYTRGHSERVSRLSIRVAEEMGLPPEEMTSMKWASILHDIGKIGISETILNKPGALSDEERKEINHHPHKGYKILEPIPQLMHAMPGILHHHERYDGKGYPQGLGGEEIPLIARIIAVADTYDAMTSTRAYRKAKSHEKSMAIIQEVAGSQLDPAVVRVFTKIIDRVLEEEAGMEDATGGGK